MRQISGAVETYPATGASGQAKPP